MPLTKKPNKKRKNISLTGNLKKLVKGNRKQILRIKNSKINKKKIKSKYKGGEGDGGGEEDGEQTLDNIINNEKNVEELNNELFGIKNEIDDGITKIKEKVNQVITYKVNEQLHQQSENSPTGEKIPQIEQEIHTSKQKYIKKIAGFYDDKINNAWEDALDATNFENIANNYNRKIDVYRKDALNGTDIEGFAEKGERTILPEELLNISNAVLNARQRADEAPARRHASDLGIDIDIDGGGSGQMIAKDGERNPNKVQSGGVICIAPLGTIGAKKALTNASLLLVGVSNEYILRQAANKLTDDLINQTDESLQSSVAKFVPKTILLTIKDQKSSAEPDVNDILKAEEISEEIQTPPNVSESALQSVELKPLIPNQETIEKISIEKIKTLLEAFQVEFEPDILSNKSADISWFGNFIEKFLRDKKQAKHESEQIPHPSDEIRADSALIALEYQTKDQFYAIQLFVKTKMKLKQQKQTVLNDLRTKFKDDADRVNLIKSKKLLEEINTEINIITEKN